MRLSQLLARLFGWWSSDTLFGRWDQGVPEVLVERREIDSACADYQFADLARSPG